MHQCLSAKALDKFLALIGYDRVEILSEGRIAINTSDGEQVFWSWIDYLQVFCMEGGIGQQFIGTLL